MSEKKALLLGAGGFLGKHAARVFAEAGWQVCGVDRLAHEFVPQEFLTRYVCLPLPDAGLATVLREWQPLFCLHAAGPASVAFSMEQPVADFHGSVGVTLDLLDAVRRFAPACRVLALSSAAVYGNPKSLPIRESDAVAPISPYGFHKLACEQLCREFSEIYGLQTASVRIFSAYGSGLRRQVCWDICEKALTKSVLELQGTGEESRDFIHGRDVAQAALTLAEHSGGNGVFAGEVYNLAVGRQTTIAELVDCTLRALGVQPLVRFDGVVPSGVPRNWEADMSKLFGLGFCPTVSLESGIGDLAQWAKSILAVKGTA